MTAEEYVNQLNENSVWVFTKQTTNFEDAILSSKLFADICYDNSINVERYFTEHHLDYGIETDRHRALVIAQLFGLITKTPFYGRGGHYTNERPTEIYDKIKQFDHNSQEYNVIKTEQILKLKIHAIIDTTGNNENYNILPVIFIYQVLKKLQTLHGISSVSEDMLYTYIMTSESYADVDAVVDYIAHNGPISQYVARYKDRSRVLTVIKNNIALFKFENQKISINPDFDEYFYTHFIENHDLDELHEQLLRDIDYSYLLYNYQNFNINLIDVPSVAQKPTQQTFQIIPETDEQKERAYIDKVDSIHEENVNDAVAERAYTIAPMSVTKQHATGRNFRTNPILGKIAIKHAYYSCECNTEHKTFQSNRTRKQYMEAHHLVPAANQKAMWDKYNINIDCLENLVSLCPNCHKAFHFGTEEVKTQMIENLYNKIRHKYAAIGFNITLDEIKQLYGITQS